MWDKSKKNDLGLVFIYDDLLNADIQRKLKAPFKFISFAYIEGYKLFHYRKAYVATKDTLARRNWGNDRVYGAVYSIKHPDVYLALLDAYYYYLPTQHGTMNNLRTREHCEAHLFNLTCLDDLLSFKFKSHMVVTCYIFTGNKEDKRFVRHARTKRYREVSGIDKANFDLLLKQQNIRR